MNCHGNHNNGNSNGNGHGNGHKGISHMLMMVLCCGAPVLILLLIPFISKVGGTGVSSVLAGIAPFLCPLMMVFMLPMMFKGGRNAGNTENATLVKQEQTEDGNLDNKV